MSQSTVQSEQVDVPLQLFISSAKTNCFASSRGLFEFLQGQESLQCVNFDGFLPGLTAVLCLCLRTTSCAFFNITLTALQAWALVRN